MLEFLKMMLNVDFLLFLLGIYWNDIALYIQNWIANCSPKRFCFIAAIFVYMFLKHQWQAHTKK